MRVLIVGAGYVGLPLARRLAELGHEVWAVRRTPGPAAELEGTSVRLAEADVTRPETLRALPGPFDWVVNTVSSGEGGPEDYRKVYLGGTKNLLEWLAATPPKKFVYTSSTSVYGQTDGAAVKETSPTEPASPTSQILVETEKALLEAAQQSRFPAVILRVSGIYGPGRGHLLQKFLRNEAKIAGQGERIINMIHLDDLVEVIIAALKNGRPGEVYNATDDEPATQLLFYRFLSETLGKWMPPFAQEEESRKRGLSNKKVQNRKLKMELGCKLKYPTFRQGYTAELLRLERAGELNVELESRENIGG